MMTRWGDGMGEPPPLNSHEDLKRRQEAVDEGGKTAATKQAA